jgi:hypothetical protein
LEELVKAVTRLLLPEVTFPLRMQLRILILSALLTAADVATLIQELPVNVAVVVLFTVRFLFVLPELGLSPLMVTLSAPFN